MADTVTAQNQNLSKRKIWVHLKRLDQTELDSYSDSDDHTVVRSLYLKDQDGFNEVKGRLCEAFQIYEEGIVFKLRNHRGSLIPMKGNIPVNSKSVPYILEVAKVHQNVTPKAKSIKISDQTETMKKRFEDIIKRVENIESVTPDLDFRRKERIESEIRELENKLVFLQKRLNEAEVSQWKGMFKKNPLW
ncbi:uncharacterized protein LOC133186430 [Saccostrea echinata]|uniref:uncharacterized protein LOC133186430 n=1 Tax=Saccostrea echinata TaxID=191078 RepID=UPI002A82772E|nr:uncharacterized protein LOC133186430 [Saccostrea echinata]